MAVARQVNTGAVKPPTGADHVSPAAAPAALTSAPQGAATAPPKRKAAGSLDDTGRHAGKAKLVSILKAPGSTKKRIAPPSAAPPPASHRADSPAAAAKATHTSQDPAPPPTTAAIKGAPAKEISPPAPGVDSPPDDSTNVTQSAASTAADSSSEDEFFAKPLVPKRRASAPPQPTGFSVMAPNGRGLWSKVRLDCPPKCTKATKAKWELAKQDLPTTHVVVMFSNNSLGTVMSEHIRPLDETKLRSKATLAGM